MKIFKSSLVLLFILAGISSTITVYADTTAQATVTVKEEDGVKLITSEGLKKLMDSKASFVLLDARKAAVRGLIPGAKLLPSGSTDEEVKNFVKSIPKDKMIVVYCANINCPVSKYLAKRLIVLGYTNVYKYPDGLSGWLDKEYPLDPQ